MTLLFLSALAASVVSFVLYPVFTRAAQVKEHPTVGDGEQKSLLEKKERIYEAIKDLDFERQAGKLSEADYRSARANFLSQAARVVARMDELAQAAPPAARAARAPQPAAAGAVQASTPPASKEGGKKDEEKRACPSCEQPNPLDAQFCLRCGTGIQTAPVCPQCGTKLPQEARFCTMCGVAIPA